MADHQHQPANYVEQDLGCPVGNHVMKSDCQPKFLFGQDCSKFQKFSCVKCKQSFNHPSHFLYLANMHAHWLNMILECSTYITLTIITLTSHSHKSFEFSAKAGQYYFSNQKKTPSHTKHKTWLN